MASDLTSRLDALRPIIKARWAARLTEAAPAPPDAAALVTPEMLVFMLDDTLARLFTALGQPPDPPGRRPSATPFGRTRGSAHCGLQLLLIYYLAGARSLREVLPATLGQDRLEVLHCFTRLAREEMTALCRACHHRGGPLCQLTPGLMPALPLRQVPPVP